MCSPMMTAIHLAAALIVAAIVTVIVLYWRVQYAG